VRVRENLTLGNLTIRESVRRSGLYGLEAWTAYAIIECLFSSVLPSLIPLARGYSVTNDGFTVFVTAVYMVFGALLGGAVGFVLKTAARSTDRIRRLEAAPLFRAAATLSVVVAFWWNVAKFASVPVSIVLAAACAIVVMISAASADWSRRLATIANPWTVGFVLVGTQYLDWQVLENRSRSYAAVVIAIYLAAILPAAAGVKRVLRGNPATVIACMLAATIGAVLLLNQTVVTAAALQNTPACSGCPNVLLVTLDTVRADHTSLYGYRRPTTPNLVALARDSIVYRQAISAGDMTLSTHASIFTGVYPSLHGAHFSVQRQVGLPLSDDFRTLPEILASQGYHTVAVVANFAYLAPTFGFARGFERYDSRTALPFLAEVPQFYLRARVRNYLTRFAEPVAFEQQILPAEKINQEVFAVLNTLRSDRRPFFLFVNYMDAHWPYLPPAPYDTLYPGKAQRFTGVRYSYMEEEVLRGDRNVTEAERRHLISQYDGAIRYLDQQVGRLISELKRQGLYDNTLLIITSDHGEAFGERHLLQHGVSVYQDQVHVPLLIKFPHGRIRTAGGTAIDSPVSSVDLLPTILDTAGVPVPKQVQGRSLLSSAPDAQRRIFAESFPSRRLISLQPRLDRIERAVISGSMKLIGSTAGRRELYDLAKDPNEDENIYAASGSGSRALETSLEQWTKAALAKSRPEGPIDPGVIERLRSLGYVQ
jgi:arylsulfatase A-like enzyme